MSVCICTYTRQHILLLIHTIMISENKRCITLVLFSLLKTQNLKHTIFRSNNIWSSLNMWHERGEWVRESLKLTIQLKWFSKIINFIPMLHLLLLYSLHATKLNLKSQHTQMRFEIGSKVVGWGIIPPESQANPYSLVNLS